MQKILLLDDDQQYLADTVKEIKLAGCDVTYLNSRSAAMEFIELNKNEIAIIIIALNNSLGYPVVRKAKHLIHKNTQLTIYSASENPALRDWIHKQSIDSFWVAPFQKVELVNHCKRQLLKKNIHFSHKQLLQLTSALAKYTSGADNLVQQHAGGSNSMQELQHKLAHCLDDYECQKRFLSEVQ